MADTDDKARKAAEKAARELFERAMQTIDEGAYKFTSRLRGQTGVIMDELVDPEGEAVANLADLEGDAGALALAAPIDLITFETWLFGQIGDQEELDLDINSHREHWINFGSWIGQMLKARHGGHWLIPSDDPHTWRMGFSKILLETAPFAFAEALLRSGPGAAKQLISEIERLRKLHEEQAEKDGGPIDRFTAQHYVRLHTIPLGQWMVMDLKALERLWNRATTRDLAKQVRVHGKKLGERNAPFIDQIVGALEQLDPDKPAGAQTVDRGLFEAIAQIIGLRRTTAPVAIDVIEKFVLPAIHMGVPDQFPPLDADDLAALRKGIELFALFIEVTPFKYPADDDGFLGIIPKDELSSPYRDRTNLDVGKGDWVIVNPKRFKRMLLDFDSKRMLDKYDEFVRYVRANPKAPRRRDDGRFLAETVVNAIADFRACVVAASKDDAALLFRMLPPPG
ncbi:MAG: hypothetical protein D6689_00410 [Deltaproteobacteria bacterium]|nr:MAG: hypothetical protein D6689_00410 [Deltaproteobacteria bacterium]